jgi:hypothetical protein
MLLKKFLEQQTSIRSTGNRVNQDLDSLDIRTFLM